MDSRQKYIEQVFGKNKERDYDLLYLHVTNPDMTYRDMAQTLNLDLTDSTISTIFKNNTTLKYKMFMDINPLIKKEGRAFELVKQIHHKKKTGSKKDLADLIEQLRKEIEGDKPLIDQSTKVYQEVRVIVENDDDIRNRVKANFQNASESGFNYQR